MDCALNTLPFEDRLKDLPDLFDQTTHVKKIKVNSLFLKKPELDP